MRQVVRFWVLVLSFTVAMLSFAYLSLTFVTFLAPDLEFIVTGTDERLAVTGVALVSLAVFVWAFSFVGGPEPETLPDEDGESGGPTLGNRNR